MTTRCPPDELGDRHDTASVASITLLTLRETAERLALSERMIRSLIAAKRLRRVQIGRAVRIDPVDLRAFVEKSKGGAR